MNFDSIPVLNLRLTVEQELLRMLARQLENSPSADELAFTAQIFTEDLVAHGLRDKDCARVSAAFNLVGRNVTRWPTPKHITSSLPPPEEPFRVLSSPAADLGRVARALADMREHIRRGASRMLDNERSRIEAESERAAIQAESEGS